MLRFGEAFCCAPQKKPAIPQPLLLSCRGEALLLQRRSDDLEERRELLLSREMSVNRKIMPDEESAVVEARLCRGHLIERVVLSGEGLRGRGGLCGACQNCVWMARYCSLLAHEQSTRGRGKTNLTRSSWGAAAFLTGSGAVQTGIRLLTLLLINAATYTDSISAS